MCPNCRHSSPTKTAFVPIANEKVGARAIDRRSPGDVLGGLIPHERFTTTIILLIKCGALHRNAVYSMGLGNGSAFMNLDGQTLYQFGAKLSRTSSRAASGGV